MQLEQVSWRVGAGWSPRPPGRLEAPPQLVLAFGSPSALHESAPLAELRAAYPGAQLFGCSTAGEIRGVRVTDETLVATAIHFERSAIRSARVRINDAGESGAAGRRLAESIPAEGLRHAFVLSDGLCVNGSELVKGLRSRLPSGVTVTGGLSGDGERFQRTFVVWDGQPEANTVGILGFYGERLTVGCGSLGGWDPFGPERLITRSEGNVLYQLDGQSALALYKAYLGQHAAGLPATGLLFPLSLRTGERETGVVRTILSIDEQRQNMTFAGDMPEGSYARLMKANFDRLIDGAVGAAKTSHAALRGSSPDLAVLISCVGRKLVLKQRVEEEVEGVREVFGEGTTLAGFYSYGEISPFTPDAKCELHNQTMTITTFTEN